MPPLQPKEFLLYYTAVILICLMVFVRRRPRRGMRLRLKNPPRDTNRTEGKSHQDEPFKILDGEAEPQGFSHIEPEFERPLNVVFNYNGHSWDAYEVLGLPAGSSPERVEEAFSEAMGNVDETSKAFMKAAHEAILAQWRTYRKVAQG